MLWRSNRYVSKVYSSVYQLETIRKYKGFNNLKILTKIELVKNL